MSLILFISSLISSILLCNAGIKDPGWKHCIHPAHALTTEWGRLSSPGFPNGINKQIQCSWVISSNPGFRIKLAFQTLNMTGSIKSCYTQFVELLDYKIGSSVGKFCGARKPGDYVSHGTRVRIDLQGDTSGEKTQGFDLRYRATREPAGFKTTWAFPSKKPSKPSRSKTKKTKKPKKPIKGGPPKSSNPFANVPPKSTGPRPGAGRGPPKQALPQPTSIPRQNPPGASLPRNLLPPTKSPPPLRTPPSNKRIAALPPPIAKPVQIRHGPDTSRSVDHGSSVVIKMDSDEEPEPKINIYLIIGVVAGGVVLLIIIIIIMKKCIFDKNKKRKRRQKAEDAKNNQIPPLEPPENYHMSMLPGAVPEQYMSEKIVQQPLSSYPHQHLVPMMQPPQQQYIEGYVSPATAPSVVMAPHRTRSSRSRARSRRSGVEFPPAMNRSKSRSSVRRSASRRSIRGSRSRSSVRGSKSRSSVRHLKSKSLQYLPTMDGQWVVVDPRYQTTGGTVPVYPQERAMESSDSTSSSDWETDSDSSDSYISRRGRRSRRNSRRYSQRKKSQPPPYDVVTSQKGFYADRTREYDEGYDTGRRTNGTKSSASRKRDDKKNAKKKKGAKEYKKKREKRKRKYSR